MRMHFGMLLVVSNTSSTNSLEATFDHKRCRLPVPEYSRNSPPGIGAPMVFSNNPELPVRMSLSTFAGVAQGVQDGQVAAQRISQ